MNRLTSRLNATDATDECHSDIFESDSLKVPKLLFRFSLRAANSLATSIRQGLSVLCLWVQKYCEIAKSCLRHRRAYLRFQSLRRRKDLSPAALAGCWIYKRKFTYGYDFTYHTLSGFRKLLDHGENVI